MSVTEVDQQYESDSIEQYQMVSNEFDYDEVKRSANFAVIHFEDSTYRGQVEKPGSKVRCGYGVMVYKNKITVNAQKAYEPFAQIDVRLKGS
jgi:hypothetical protein